MEVNQADSTNQNVLNTNTIPRTEAPTPAEQPERSTETTQTAPADNRTPDRVDISQAGQERLAAETRETGNAAPEPEPPPEEEINTYTAAGRIAG